MFVRTIMYHSTFPALSYDSEDLKDIHVHEKEILNYSLIIKK